MRQLIVVAHDIRSAHNVGALLRTADGLGVERLFLTGHSPYPQTPGDPRLPHLASQQHRRIQKTALGAELSVKWEYHYQAKGVIERLSKEGYGIVGLEQTDRAEPLPSYRPPQRLALLLGNEISGLPVELLNLCHQIVHIPMSGTKESFNVAAAAAMALYHLRFTAKSK